MEKNTNSVQEAACPFATIRQSMMILAMTAMVLLLAPIMSLAQAFQEVDLSQLGLNVVAPNTQLSMDQVAELSFEVGGSQGVSDAIGYNIWIQLSAHAQHTTSLEPTMAGSWMASTGASITEYNLGNGLYRYTFLRPTAASGAGMILKLRVKAAHDGVWAADLRTTAGGLMQIDNLDLRVAGHGLAVAPNPVKAGSVAALHVQASGEQIANYAIVAFDGRVLGTSTELQPIDLSVVPAGRYWLRATTANGRRLQRVLVVD